MLIWSICVQAGITVTISRVHNSDVRLGRIGTKSGTYKDQFYVHFGSSGPQTNVVGRGNNAFKYIRYWS